MKNFFQGFNTARAIIVLSLLGSLVLGYFCWSTRAELAELRDDLDHRIEPTVQSLRKDALRHTQLMASLKGEGLQSQKDLETYIRTISAADRVDMGSPRLDPSEAPLSKGVVDKKYRIRSSDRDRSYQRLNITNFLYKLEQDSRRVKVTDLKLEIADKRIKEHEIPEDRWTFEAEVTSRQRASD